MLWRSRQRCNEERRSCGDRSLKRVQAVIEWQQRVSTKRHDDRLLFERKHCGAKLLRIGF